MNVATERPTYCPDRDRERRVLNFLRSSRMPGLRNLEVEATSGTVTLRGTVNTFYEKQIGQQCCRRVGGVLKLVDAINVAAPTTLN